MEVQIASMDKSTNKWLFLLEQGLIYIRILGLLNMEETVKTTEEYRDRKAVSAAFHHMHNIYMGFVSVRFFFLDVFISKSNHNVL